MPPTHRTRSTAELVRGLRGTDPITVAELASRGVSVGAIRAAVRSGALERLRDGVVAVPLPAGSDLWAVERRRALAALLRLHPSAAASHETGRILQRLPDPRPGAPAPSVVVVTAARSGGLKPGLRIVSHDLDPRDVDVVGGVRCTAVPRTALDVAVGRPLREGLVVLDAAVARTGPAEVLEAYERLPRLRGLRGLREAVTYADGRAESPLESASRGVMIEARLPQPQLQQWVADLEGRRWRVDFLWAGLRVIGEADGWVKYESMADLRAEKRREDALRRAGWTVVRWTSDELWHEPAVVVARIAHALASSS